MPDRDTAPPVKPAVVLWVSLAGQPLLCTDAREGDTLARDLWSIPEAPGISLSIVVFGSALSCQGRSGRMEKARTLGELAKQGYKVLSVKEEM
ncbi:MAG TPA: hypothetical protein VE844_13050, partial [Gammaproteobacteria bacterium]|nr:hypothetical protein [Gammaproteobacteria bacterium]